MSVPQLKIAGVTLAFEDFAARQHYEPLNGSTIHRMASGAALRQQHWSKLRTTISGSGWLPPDLAGVDWSAAFTLDCIAPRSIYSATNSTTLPAARRSDAAAFAFAYVAGAKVSTPVSVVGSTATATVVSGASGYSFNYFPSLNCVSEGPKIELDAETGQYSWEITAEET